MGVHEHASARRPSTRSTSPMTSGRPPRSSISTRPAGAADALRDPLGSAPDVVRIAPSSALTEGSRSARRARRRGRRVGGITRGDSRDERAWPARSYRQTDVQAGSSCGSSSATAPDRLGCRGRRGSRTPARPGRPGRRGRAPRTPCPRRRSHQARSRASIRRRRGRWPRRPAHGASSGSGARSAGSAHG